MSNISIKHGRTITSEVMSERERRMSIDPLEDEEKILYILHGFIGDTWHYNGYILFTFIFFIIFYMYFIYAGELLNFYHNNRSKINLRSKFSLQINFHSLNFKNAIIK